MFLGTNGVLKAVDNRNQNLLWQHEMNGILTRLMFAGRRLIVINNRTIAALDGLLELAGIGRREINRLG